MTDNDESTASHQFVGHPPIPLSKVMSKMIADRPDAKTSWGRLRRPYYVFMGVAAAVIYGGFYLFDHAPAGWSHSSTATVLAIAVVVGVLGYLGWYNTREILIRVTSDGLSVNRRRCDISSFSDAKLGLWAWGNRTMGTALHLRSGPHRIVLGGRDHRLGAETPVGEPPVSYVDAWLWASEFDELLTTVSRRSGMDVHRPTSGEPTRCLLFPNVELTNHRAWRLVEKVRLVNSAWKPRLAIDVGEDEIRVIHPNSTAPVATARLAQVSATPAKHNCWRKGCYESSVLVLRVPGLQPLTIRCLDPAKFGQSYNYPRFSWRGKVQEQVKTPAEYSVSSMDWLTVVEKFGLAPYQGDSAK
jgi:hypothetical protein